MEASDPIMSTAEAPGMFPPDLAAPEPATDPPHTKRPAAVTLVIALGAATALAFLALGGHAAWTLARCGGLDVDLRPVLCGRPPRLIDPRELLADAVHGLLVGVAMTIILAGFTRLRAWSWVALMTWGGYVLARDLLWYYLFPDARSGRYVTMVLAALIVLALNQEDVQKAFGIQRDAHDLVPLRGAENPGDRV